MGHWEICFRGLTGIFTNIWRKWHVSTAKIDRQKTSYVWPLLRLRWHCLSCRGKGALFAVDIQLGLLNVNTPSAGVFCTKIRSHLGDSMINILCFLRSYYATWQWLYIALINFNLTSNLKKNTNCGKRVFSCRMSDCWNFTIWVINGHYWWLMTMCYFLMTMWYWKEWLSVRFCLQLAITVINNYYFPVLYLHVYTMKENAR